MSDFLRFLFPLKVYNLFRVLGKIRIWRAANTYVKEYLMRENLKEIRDDFLEIGCGDDQ
mgnify:CR=1 FL=1